MSWLGTTDCLYGCHFISTNNLLAVIQRCNGEKKAKWEEIEGYDMFKGFRVEIKIVSVYGALGFITDAKQWTFVMKSSSSSLLN